MRAWYLDEAPGSYQFGEIPTPEPGPGEVRIELRASGLNHLDLWVAKGMPAPHEFPHVSGGDGAGVVDAIGDGVTSVSPGDEVVIHPTVSWTGGGDAQILGEHAQGTLAEYVVVPAANAFAKPANLSWEEAGSFALATGTAWRMLRRARLTDGAKVLVVGVGGGVSSAALGIAVAMGADVWVTSRDPQKIAWAKELGAVDGFDSTEEFARAVKGATDGGVDIVVENVGAATWNQSMRSLVTGGRLVTCGSTAGAKVEITIPYLFFKQLELIGSTMFGPDDFAEVLELVALGRIPVKVDSVFGFDEVPAALTHLEAGEQFGKIAIGR
jgi:zinc-binding alcohol dehydrogenase/oxidoreductase